MILRWLIAFVLLFLPRSLASCRLFSSAKTDKSFVQAYELASKWHHASSSPSKLAQFTASDLDPFGAEQTMVFLEKLQSYKSISIEAVRKMDEVYAFGKSKNAELSFRFLTVSSYSLWSFRLRFE